MNFFRDFVKEVEEKKKKYQKIKVEYSLQTNGILLNEEWCAFLNQYSFLVGLSLDMLAEYHNENRVTPEGKGTYHAVCKAKNLLDKYNVEYNILTVLTNTMAQHPQKVWNYLKQQKIQYVQFVPCLDELMMREKNKYALTPGRFASFYIQIFKLWLEELQKGHYISIKLFDDILNLFLEKKVTACGLLGKCSPQIVTEADGSVYPCDFYALDKYKVGNLSNQTLFQILGSPAMRMFVEKSSARATECKECLYWHMCGGGCKRMKNAVYGNGNSEICGYRQFLEKCLPDLLNVANQIEKSL